MRDSPKEIAIQETVEEINRTVLQMKEEGALDGRSLTLALEANQKYIDYLDQLLDVEFELPSSRQVIGLGDKKVKFTFDDFVEFIADRISNHD